MEDNIAYYALRFLRKPVLIVITVLLLSGLTWGLIIGNVQKGIEDVYMKPVGAFFTLVLNFATEKASNRIERILEKVIPGMQKDEPQEDAVAL